MIACKFRDQNNTHLIAKGDEYRRGGLYEVAVLIPARLTDLRWAGVQRGWPINVLTWGAECKHRHDMRCGKPGMGLSAAVSTLVGSPMLGSLHQPEGEQQTACGSFSWGWARG
eukprot:93258-Rhodomonas_salina.1